MRGVFELDDILNNSIGAIIGWATGRKIKREYIHSLGIASTLALGLAVAIIPSSVSNLPRAFCFQVKNDGSGFCFRSGYMSPENYSIVLKSITTGETRELRAETGIERADVAYYFGDDYLSSGFQTILPKDNEYEILIKYNPILIVPTGVYVGITGVHFVVEKERKEPRLMTDFIKHGQLLVSRPDYHCWVYQNKGALYWIVDKDFSFEEDCKTRIECQLWTTKKEQLPQERIKNGWMWDNIGCNFEDYELEGEWDGYRVMKRELPHSYPITSILTGCYKDGKWIWRSYFRPIYEFGE